MTPSIVVRWFCTLGVVSLLQLMACGVGVETEPCSSESWVLATVNGEELRDCDAAVSLNIQNGASPWLELQVSGWEGENDANGSTTRGLIINLLESGAPLDALDAMQGEHLLQDRLWVEFVFRDDRDEERNVVDGSGMLSVEQISKTDLSAKFEFDLRDRGEQFRVVGTLAGTFNLDAAIAEAQ